MKVKLIQAGVITLIIVEGLVAVIMTREILVLLATGLMIIAGLLLRDSEDWGFYIFTAAIPLVVTIGDLFLPAGGIILVTTLGLFFLDSCQYWNRKEYAIATLLMLVILSAAIVSPFIAGVIGLGVILVIIAVTGSALALFRNRLLKRHYMGDTG
jgi:hypothetical protein